MENISESGEKKRLFRSSKKRKAESGQGAYALNGASANQEPRIVPNTSLDGGGGDPKAPKVDKVGLDDKRWKKTRRENRPNGADSFCQPGPVRRPKPIHDVTKKSTTDSNSRYGLKTREDKHTKPPSEEALALSSALKILSARKHLAEALALYYRPSNDSIRDAHHGSILIDCCSRCGDIKEAEAVMQSLGTVGVVTKTALLKGYAHAGYMNKGTTLFREMCVAKDKRNRPNIRTLNTLLRGCLWTASCAYSFNTVALNDSNSLHSKKQQQRQQVHLAGGVISSEEAWQLFLPKSSFESEKLQFDLSSYDYSISLLCQALRIKEAEERLNDMKRQHRVFENEISQNTLIADRSSVLESLGLAHVNMARACALLGKKDLTKLNADNALKALNALSAAATDAGNKDNVKFVHDHKQGAVTGGKRAWKPNNSSNGESSFEESCRATSNTFFRTHRLNELRAEASNIANLCTKPLVLEAKHLLAKYIATRLIYFSGGGKTSLDVIDQINNNVLPKGKDNQRLTVSKSDIEMVRAHLINAQWLSFGLAVAVGCTPSSGLSDLVCNETVSILTKKERLALRESIGGELSRSVLSDDGYLNYNVIFAPIYSTVKGIGKANNAMEESNERPLHIELGAGSGDWIVSQGKRNPTHNYISVELRADRVAQTFSKCMLNTNNDGNEAVSSPLPIENVCCVGSECRSFLHQRIKDGSVHTIFVNHPEPPTQSFGSHEQDLSSIMMDEAEPAHMLNSATLITAAKCLKLNGVGRIVIVTDNRWYAKLICCTLQKVMAKHKNLLSQVPLDDDIRYFERVETFPDHRNEEGAAFVALYHGRPCEAIGHLIPKTKSRDDTNGVSYFDRLWKSGAGKHAETKTRFIVVMQSYDAASSSRSRSQLTQLKKGESFERPSLGRGIVMKGCGAENEKKRKKKSAAKQKRRNERRLLNKLDKKS